MPYFHATAVFEARSSSVEEADRAVVALFKALRHPRVLYYEHDTSGASGPYRPSGPLYFTVTADFDVEASSEDGAVDIVEEVLDITSTDAIQYFALGITSGERRVRPEQRASRAADHEPEREARFEQEDREDRGGRKRGSRGRGRRRRGGQDGESAREEETETQEASPLHEESAQPPAHAGTSRAETPVAEVTSAEGGTQEREQPAPAPVTAEAVPPSTPPRSSAAMRVTLAVTLHASELTQPTNGSTLPDQQELISLATAEALRRHPELPAEVIPKCEVVSLPWGDIVLTLTWHYDVPVPSAADEA